MEALSLQSCGRKDLVLYVMGNNTCFLTALWKQREGDGACGNKQGQKGFLEEVRSGLFGLGPPHLSLPGLSPAFTLTCPRFVGSLCSWVWPEAPIALPSPHGPRATLYHPAVQVVLRTKGLPGNQAWSQSAADRIRSLKWTGTQKEGRGSEKRPPPILPQAEATVLPSAWHGGGQPCFPAPPHHPPH